jgi:nitrate reductase gamma subunit
MGAFFSFLVVAILIIVAFIGVKVAGLAYLFGVVLPYLAFLVFTVGMIYRVVKWSKSPVPFRIPTTGGQQKTLPWIKPSKLDNPSTGIGVIGRMLLEIFLFRSLFRNTRTELHQGPRLAYKWEKWLWLAGLAFHWSFFIVLIRHLRFFTNPVPSFLKIIEGLDGFLQIGTPRLLMTGLILLGAVTYLLLRRFYIPQVRYISLPADYFPLLSV